MTDSILYNEISEQPGTLKNLLEIEGQHIRELALLLKKKRVEYVVLAARGTSDNAARYAQYLFGTALGLPVALAAPSLHTIYEAKMRFEHALVIGISQSGKSPDIAAVLEHSREVGSPTLAITNVGDSPLAQAAEHVIELHVGQERSVAATKTYTAQLMVLAMLVLNIAEDTAGLAALQHVPDAVAQTLSLDGRMREVAHAIAQARAMVTLSRGYNYATAWEVAQKLKELTYIPTEPYSLADFQHGPIAMLSEDIPVLAFAPSGAAANDTLELAPRLRERGSPLVVISDIPSILEQASLPVQLPTSIDERFSPITAVIPGQQLALYMALERGIEPDHPRGLRKVTETL